MDCRHCQAPLADSHTRLALTDAAQRIVWGDAGDAAEVDIREATEFAYFCCSGHARAEVRNMLALIGAEPKWSDAQPIEACAACGADIDTSDWHRVLGITDERGPLHTPDAKTLVQCPARFCSSCNPA
jgi:hypothetical protein